jgi:hypothetical protein
MSEYRNTMKQIGVIVFGGGINARAWIDAERAVGHVVMIRAGYAEVYA